MIINILLFFECHLVLLKFIQSVYTIKLKQYDKYSIVVCAVTTYKCRLGMFWCLPWFWNAWNPYALKNENKSYATDRIEMFRIIWSLSIGKWHWKMPNNVCFNPPVIHTWQKLFTCIPGRSWRARLKNLFEHKRSIDCITRAVHTRLSPCLVWITGICIFYELFLENIFCDWKK